MSMEAKATFDEVSSPGSGSRRSRLSLAKRQRSAPELDSQSTLDLHVNDLGVHGGNNHGRGRDSERHRCHKALVSVAVADKLWCESRQHPSCSLGKVISSAGVSSSIDMALTLAVLLSDDLHAQASQLYNEYDPNPVQHRHWEQSYARTYSNSEEWNDDLVAKMDGTS